MLTAAAVCATARDRAGGRTTSGRLCTAMATRPCVPAHSPRTHPTPASTYLRHAGSHSLPLRGSQWRDGSGLGELSEAVEAEEEVDLVLTSRQSGACCEHGHTSGEYVST